jgi:uncharacterized protein
MLGEVNLPRLLRLVFSNKSVVRIRGVGGACSASMGLRHFWRTCQVGNMTGPFRFEQFGDPEGFLSKITPFLIRREAEHNLLFGILSTLIENPRAYGDAPPLLVTVNDDSDVAAVALMTPPRNLAISLASPQALGFLADLLVALGSELPGVTGPAAEARIFADQWARLRGVQAHSIDPQRIYRLDAVRDIPPVSGTMRPCVEADTPLLMRWIAAFGQDTGISDEVGPAVQRYLHGRESGLMIWEDREAVSMSGYGGPTPNGIRISTVYTPPIHRRKGYARACVAALSKMLLERGRRFCFLFTQLSNPTSNHIYQQIGYEPVCDVDLYRFV